MLFETLSSGIAKYALVVAVIRSGITYVDQQRLPFGSDDESGAAAFHIHPIDVQIACGSGYGDKAGQKRCEDEFLHGLYATPLPARVWGQSRPALAMSLRLKICPGV